MVDMTNILSAILIGGATGGGLLVGDAISGSSTIPLGQGIAVAVFGCSIVYYIGRKFQSLEDNHKELRHAIKDLPCHGKMSCMDSVVRRLRRIEGKLGLVPYEDIVVKEKETSTT
jgi:hypothetical protein